ncbi:MAG TPA: trypsin-like peptidase domain-containing protein [Opitutaceae bacterium]|nr:trypsin-like peptidase domain-containing protein [Opitutaceae bacterium]
MARSFLPVLGAVILSGLPSLVAAQPATAPAAAPTVLPGPGGPKEAPQEAKAPAGEANAPSVENSVVKVFTTMRHPDVYRPWTKQAPSDATGSGVVIGGKRILTNAHVVLYSSQVQIQANQAGDKIAATVEMVAPGIDLAVLKLDDESFFETHAPLPRASTLPDIKDSVLVYGYPTGGTSLSITKGIVSRIEFASYNYPTSGLRIQIDAAINPGNSGGPAVAGNTMIGLAFSHLGGAENIGYIIPCEEIELFLNEIAGGHYHGKPAFFDELQTLENPALRSFLKLAKADQGIVIHKVDSDDPSYPLREWDVITKIGDTDVDDQGMVHQGDNLRLKFQYLVQKIARNGTVSLTVVRAGKRLQFDVPVSTDRALLIPSLDGDYPPYFVYGPLVFSRLSAEFVSGIANRGGLLQGLSYIASPLVTRRGDKPAFPGEELVVVTSPFFPHKLSKGYDHAVARTVDTVNGTKIRNLRHLVEVLRDAKGEFITFAFAGRGGETLIFPRQEMLAATDEILTDNGVRAQASPELLAVWQAKPAP